MKIYVHIYIYICSLFFMLLPVPAADSKEKAYLGTSPRSQIQNTTYVFTAADFDSHRAVPVHLEMSFRDSPPATQLLALNI